MKPKTAIQYMKFFNTIPADQWRVGSGYQGPTCALGHVSDLDGMADYSHPLSAFLGSYSRGHYGRIVPINDGVEMGFDGVDYSELGDSPKERVMNALLLKAAGVWEELFDEKG